MSACSSASSFTFLSMPPAYPVRLPPVPTTRWHGMIIEIFVMPDSAAHGLRRHPGPSLLFRKLPRELTVGHGLPVGNLQQQRPHRLLKHRASRVQRRQKARLLPRKVKVQPAPGLGKDRRFPFGMLGGQSVGKIFSRRRTTARSSRPRPPPAGYGPTGHHNAEYMSSYMHLTG